MKLLLPPDTNRQRKVLDTTARQILIIGANGAGKTRFTDYLVDEMHGRSFCLSGLDALYGSRPDSGRKTHPGSIDDLFQKMVARYPLFRSDIPLTFDRHISQLLNEEITNLISNKVASANGKRSNRTRVTKLDKVIDAWQTIFSGNRILIKGGQLTFLREDDTSAYSSMRLSDGERAALYYLGAVLFAPENGAIFIDNPAMFLHPTVSNLIWDKVEDLRPDCTFIYTTHDLDFAATRTDNAVVWVRDFDPANTTWDYTLLPDHSGIPEDVYLSIIGARKPVLFIEGVAQRSIDHKIYPLIFTDFTVRALGSCNKVIESVRTFNDLNAFHHLDSYGIVDRDRRSGREVEYLRHKKILVPEVAEVENLLLLEGVIKAVARHQRRDERKVFAKVKATLFKLFANAMTAQALEHTRHRVKRLVEFRIDGKFTNIGMLEDHMADLVNEINPRNIYNELCSEFKTIVDTADYQGVLRVYNDKTMISNTNVAALCGLRNKEQYLSTIISILKRRCTEATMIRQAIMEAFGIADGFENVAATR
ncbi:MAG: DUF4435 domain-containing protein [Muribaculaceae bacterium]|nr:DUF4435 domain-containing protein [Muribaculaceae bacterium]